MKYTLIGYMGSGKSTLGRQLAAKLVLPYIDLDAEIEQVEGLTISEIVDKKGELYFRKKEKELLQLKLSQDQFVLSVGGGTPCYFNNMEEINSKSESIYLDVSLKTLTDRLQKEKKQRPLIAHIEDENLKEFVAKHLFERRRFYEEAKMHVQGEAIELSDITDQIHG